MELAAPFSLMAPAYAATGSSPRDLGELKYTQASTGSYVTGIFVDTGTISIAYGNQANRLIAGRVLSLRPTAREHGISWSCGYRTADGGNPAGGAAGEDRTTVLKKFLPRFCRG